MEKAKPFLLLAIVSLATTFLLWLPFILRIPSFWGISLPQNGLATVVANFDGPYYIVAAKTLYDPRAIEQNFSFPLSPIYYSAHYPLFPILIKIAATIFPFLGYPYAMVLVTVLTSILTLWVFYRLLEEFGLKRHALWLAILFAVLPGRWLVVRSIGSPEPLFLLTIMASILYFRRKRWLLAGIFGALAQATKPPGLLLFFAYLIALIAPYWPKLAHTDAKKWFKELPWRAYPIFFIPLTLILIYIFYGLRYGNFLAYFNSGDNIHLMFPPFRIFNPDLTWVGTFWLEEIIWIYLFGALGLLYLIKQKRTILASFVGVFFFFILFVSHRDIARYSLPIVPFLFIAFSNLLASKEFKWAMILLAIPLYLYSIAFIAGNVTPVGDWGPLL